jgi:hypothetical protein
MAESVESVKAVAAFLRTAAEKNQNAETRALLFEHALAADFAAQEIVKLKGLTSALPPDLGNIYDLPQELLDELSIAKGDELEDQLVTVINAYGGEASLDQILVGLFRKFGSLQKRRFIQNKLYRMEMVWSVEGKKGFYTTTKPVEVPPANRWDDEPEQPGKGISPSDMEDEVPF